MCEDHYLPNEFNYIGFEASSGGLSCPDSDARMNYYGMGGIPDIRFDGNWHIQVGAPASDVNGQSYMAIIDSHRAVAAPMAVIVSDFSYVEPGAFAEIKVKMFDDIGSPANHVIRVAIVEDDLVYGGVTYHNTLVDMLAETPLTVSNNGEEQIVNLDIAIGAGWNTEKLQIIAFVQRDTDKYVIQSGNSFVGEYGAAVGVTGPQQMIADGGQVTFGTTNVINVGLNPDVFDVTIDTNSLPNGWDAHMVYDGVDYQTFSMPLDAFDSGSFYVVMNTGSVGSGRVIVDIASQGSGNLVESLDFVGLAGGTDLLVVADDDGAGYAYDYYAPAIDPSGKTYAIWDRGLAAVAGDDLLAYDAVIWQTGANSQGMAAEDRTALDAYLAAGGKVILAGEDLLEGLYNQGGSARLWYQLKLRINYATGNSGNLVVDGQPGTVGGGLNFTLAGGDPDQVSLLNGQEAYVTEAFRFGDGDPAGTQTEYNGYMVLTLPWGLERVPSESDRAAIIDGALDWMGLLNPLAADDVPVAGAVLLQNAPNPFNPITKIALVMDQTGPARLEIFNSRGQLVRVLVDETLAVGNHSIVWNGKTDSGQQAASGTYFYRLSTNGDQLTRKMSLVK